MYFVALLTIVAATGPARAQWTGGTYTATATENLGAITVNGNAMLTINEGVTVTVNGGINVASGTLTVTGPGTLVVNGAEGNDGADGEPGGNGGVAISGNIIVQGGATVTATGGNGGKGGDGDDHGGTGGTGGVAISGNIIVQGDATVTATGGDGGNGGNGWDGAYGGNGRTGGFAFAGTLTYKSGTVTANGGSGGSGGSGEPGGSSGSDGKAFANPVDFAQTTVEYTLTDGTNTITTISNQKTVVIAEPELYTIRLAEGTEEAANWTLASGNASVPGTQVLQGITSGSPLTATYNGDLKIKEVIATKHLEPNEIPLTIEALTNGNVVLNDFAGTGTAPTFKYSVNGGEMQTFTPSPGVTRTINVTAGDKIQFFGNNSKYDFNAFSGDADVKAYGNIMSLVDENGFATATTLTANSVFSYLFGNYAHLKDISGLVLPATTLSQNCYMSMFANCTTLTTVPSDLLPATTLANRCYVAMFDGCENLTNVPTLPATTLAELCYNNMFRACTGLTTVPTDLLPATTLATSCYSYMFLNCSNLTTAPALPATALAEKCYQSMFSNCTGLTTVPSDLLPATTLAEKCYQQMFYGCENLAASPVLPATTLASYCYRQMFYDCSNLSSVTCLATSGINQNSSTEYWLERAGGAVQGTKTVNAASSANWPMNNDSGIPSDWTLVTPAHTPLTMEALTDGTVKVNDFIGVTAPTFQYSVNGGARQTYNGSAQTINVTAGDKIQFFGNNSCYDGTIIAGGTADVKVYGNIMSLVDEENFATATTLSVENQFYNLFATNNHLKDASGLLLPATTLASSCYSYMFRDCNSLTAAPVLPATTLAEGCYYGMFQDCRSLTTAPELPAPVLVDYCYSNMFYNCRKLNSVTCLATSGINQSNSTDYWLYNAGIEVEGTKTFNAVSTATWPTSISGIPSGWTRQNIDN